MIECGLIACAYVGVDDVVVKRVDGTQTKCSRVDDLLSGWNVKMAIPGCAPTPAIVSCAGFVSALLTSSSELAHRRCDKGVKYERQTELRRCV